MIYSGDNMEIKDINEIEGIESDNPQALKMLTGAVRTAAESVEAIRNAAGISLDDYVESPLYRTAVGAVAQTVSVMLHSLSARCTLQAPSANIDIVPDEKGNLIYRCQHPAPHEWGLDGSRRK